MRLKILLFIFTSIAVVSTYFYGFNTGSDVEKSHIKNVLIPLCDMVTLDSKQELKDCLVGSI